MNFECKRVKHYIFDWFCSGFFVKHFMIIINRRIFHYVILRRKVFLVYPSTVIVVLGEFCDHNKNSSTAGNIVATFTKMYLQFLEVFTLSHITSPAIISFLPIGMVIQYTFLSISIRTFRSFCRADRNIYEIFVPKWQKSFFSNHATEPVSTKSWLEISLIFPQLNIINIYTCQVSKQFMYNFDKYQI